MIDGDTHTVATVFSSPEAAAIVVKFKPEFGNNFAYVKFSNREVQVVKAVRRLTVDMSRNEARDLLRGITRALSGESFSPSDLQLMQRELEKALSPTSALTMIGYSHD